MTTSPESPPQRSYPRYTQKDFAQRPDDSSAQSPLVKVLWITLVVLFGIGGIYLLAILFSALVGLIANDNATGPTPAEQTREAPATTPAGE